MTAAPAPLTIVYVVGTRNCGSTLLDALLGAAPGARSLGEVGGFHRYRKDRPCACRQPPGSCGPCRAVLAAFDAGGGWEAYRRRAPVPLRERRFFWTLVGTRGRAAYARDADALFDAAAAATGATVLVDSSKNVGRGAALAYDSRHDVRVVHAVRDGRGYLRSQRTRAAADGHRFVAPAALAAWLAKNALASLLTWRLPAGRTLRTRYEDLMADPAGELRRLGAFAGLDLDGVAERATGEGVERLHLYEPRRRTDYRTVRLDPSRLAGQRRSPGANLRYWLLGGFLTAPWGYDRSQRYLDRVPDRPSLVG